MIITLTPEQEKELEVWAQRVIAAELYDGVRTPGYTISVFIGLDGQGYARASSDIHKLDLGPVAIQRNGGEVK